MNFFKLFSVAFLVLILGACEASKSVSKNGATLQKDGAPDWFMHQKFANDGFYCGYGTGVSFRDEVARQKALLNASAELSLKIEALFNALHKKAAEIANSDRRELANDDAICCAPNRPVAQPRLTIADKNFHTEIDKETTEIRAWSVVKVDREELIRQLLLRLETLEKAAADDLYKLEIAKRIKLLISTELDSSIQASGY